MKRIIRLTESELTNLVKRLISENPFPEENLPIEELYVNKAIGGQSSYVMLDDDSKHKVKILSPECEDGSYSQNEIPNGCVATIFINDPQKEGTYYCSRNGCELNVARKGEVVVSRPSRYIEFDLKEPIDNFEFIKYDKKTGEILGNGEIGRVVAKTQPNKDEDWVRDWFKRNKIKVF